MYLQPLALFANASGTKALTFKVASAKTRPVIIVNKQATRSLHHSLISGGISENRFVMASTLNVGVAPGEMRLGHLEAGGDCVTVQGEARTLACIGNVHKHPTTTT